MNIHVSIQVCCQLCDEIFNTNLIASKYILLIWSSLFFATGTLMRIPLNEKEYLYMRISFILKLLYLLPYYVHRLRSSLSPQIDIQLLRKIKPEIYIRDHLHSILLFDFCCLLTFLPLFWFTAYFLICSCFWKKNVSYLEMLQAQSQAI